MFYIPDFNIISYRHEQLLKHLKISWGRNCNIIDLWKIASKIGYNFFK